MIQQKEKHWTAYKHKDYQFSVAFDFVSQIEDRLDELNYTQAEFAKILNVTEKSVARIIRNPGHISLISMIKWTKALKMKLTVVIYNDNDSGELSGPLLPDILVKCWKKAGKPVIYSKYNKPKIITLSHFDYDKFRIVFDYTI